MAELTFKSAGVSTREIDLTGPTQARPQGIPAGIIGTAQKGAAFVPITFATYQDFVADFGGTDGEKFGPLAVNEWMRNARAGTYVRILGVGNAQKKNTTTGVVANAGYVVGAKQVQADGQIGANPYMGDDSNATADAASLADAIDLAGVSDGNSFTLNVPVSAGGDGVDHIFLFDTTNNINSNEVATTYGFSTSIGGGVSDADLAQDVVDAINQAANGGVKYGATDIGSNSTGVDLGITATLTSGTKVTLTVDTTGDEGNVAVLTRVGGFAGALLVVTAMTGGADATGPFGRTYFLGAFHADANDGTILKDAGFAVGAGTDAQPIIRGVLFSPQGVNLGLSSINASNNEPQSVNAATGEFGTDAGDDGGWMTGSVDIGTGKQEFVMLLNGHAKSLEYPNILSASFDPNAANYFWNVFNTDPTLVEKAGHYLKDHWNVYPSHNILTGSNATFAGARTGTKHELAFLLTGSQARNVGTAAVPNYENFETRFKTAFSPWVVSQKFGGSSKNLFKIYALDDGASANNRFKVSVENIVKSNNEAAPYGSFDLAVREFADDDDNPVVFERFVKLSLNPGSERYISRVIGDRYAYYDFDKNEGAQKLVIEGTHNNASKYIRVSVDSSVKYGTMEKEALPCGFRGHHHLVTSGSNFLATTAIDTAGGGTKANILEDARQLPVPMRDTIHLGQSPKKRANAALYWGVQFQVKDSVKEPNKNRNLDKSLRAFTCMYPNHRLDWQNVWVGDNAGTLDVNDTVLDSDRFNNNKFTLENVQVKTSSVKDIPSSKDWHNAAYRRDGALSYNTDLTLANSRFLDVSKDFGELSVKKYLKFSFFVQGGFDGLNPFDEEKTKMTDTAARREMVDSLNQKGVKDSTVAAYRKAIDVMEEKSDVDIQLLAIPGIRIKEVTDYAIDSVETRFDAMLIMDLSEYDNTLTVVTSSAEQMISVTNTVDKFLSRNLDTSFAAAYFPDVVITDPATLTNVKCPPSVAVLGAFSLNDAVAHPWYAPAGFTRGALSSVIESQVKLSRTNLDDLYEADINPITAFPHTPGVVVFGQKTLQAHASALDRVNVRRLLIEIRRQVKRIGNTLLFEPNREDTLARFSNAVNPVLQRIQAQQGLDRFKVVIDTTTTTQADVENNTLRGKIFLQPTRAVEFISLDFVITNAGTEV